MRWTPALIISLIISLGLIGLGMWLIFQGTDGAAANVQVPATTTVQNTPTQEANPAALGFGLLAGGVLLGFMAFRKV